MKRILLLLFLTFSAASFCNAQSLSETLEWLNVKRSEIDLNNCYSNVVKNGTQKRTLTLTTDSITLADVLGAYTDNPWKAIKEVKIESSYAKIIFKQNSVADGKPQTIWLRINDEVIREKYVKALRHMATLKEAKLIDEDLF